MRKRGALCASSKRLRRPSLTQINSWHGVPARITHILSLGVLVAIFILAALLADFISPYSPWERFEPFSPPSQSHWLGTNDLGNDIFSELIHGSRISLVVGFGTAGIATFLGLLIGLWAGYYKGFIDEVLMGFTDIFLLVPRIPLIIVLAAFMKPNAWVITLLLGAIWWPSTARVIRSQTLQVREMAFVRSAVCLGFKNVHILFSEILPNLVRVLIPKFMITFASALIAEASVSFLGLGDPAAKSWGIMLSMAFTKGGFINRMWWWYLPPGLCITLMVLAVMLLEISYEVMSNKG